VIGAGGFDIAVPIRVYEMHALSPFGPLLFPANNMKMARVAHSWLHDFGTSQFHGLCYKRLARVLFSVHKCHGAWIVCSARPKRKFSSAKLVVSDTVHITATHRPERREFGRMVIHAVGRSRSMCLTRIRNLLWLASQEERAQHFEYIRELLLKQMLKLPGVPALSLLLGFSFFYVSFYCLS
jgi:hypothetical protein